LKNYSKNSKNPYPFILKKMVQKILIIGYVWPEPNSSAAGSRMMQLISVFLSQGWEVVFASPAQESAHRYPLEALGVQVHSIELNNDSFDTYVKELAPTMVLFDRFMMEEQFGWRVSQNCPDALRILDTEDLHCLRKAREKSVKEGKKFKTSDLNSTLAVREIASMYRCDLSLLISGYEMTLLTDHFKVPQTILAYVPFLANEISAETMERTPTFPERKHFVTVGSFLHAPNWDCVRYLKEEIWPELRRKNPTAEMHVYGSYPTQKAFQLHNPKERFLVKGWAKDAQEVVKNARVCLAPLRFGAGMKGKLLEAMICGTPSVTTEIGAEAMHADLSWNGFIENKSENFVKAATQLYNEEKTWLLAQENGIAIVNTVYAKKNIAPKLVQTIENIQRNLQAHRIQNFTGSMLLHHSMKSTEFMSRWIVEKNKNANAK
jgi:glycosyltransferase involved in cell wall biosynthesis